MFYCHCECGWLNLTKKQEQPSDKCQACDKPLTPDQWKKCDPQDWAGMICTLADMIGPRVREHAKQHGLFIYQLSKNRYVLLKEGHAFRINYKDGEGRSYMELETICGPADWQTVMKALREKTPSLPKYLVVSE